MFLGISFDAASVRKVHSDPETRRIIRTNCPFADTLGYRTENLVGHMEWELTWPEDLDMERGEYTRVRVHAGDVGAYVREKRYIRIAVLLVNRFDLH
jgi:hypothetical protein